MSANVIENKFTVLTKAKVKKKKARRRIVWWPATAFLSFVGSGFCFLTGLLLSATTALSLIPASRFAAYGGVAILFFAFLLAFAGAHAMDRIEEERRMRERAQFYERNSSVVDLTSAKIRLSKKI